MQQTIVKLQNQINQLINLVIELTQSVIADDGKKLEIISKMNDIKNVEKSTDNPEVQVVKTVKADVSKKSNGKEVTKRKEYSKKTTPYNKITNNEETKGSVSYLIHWYEDVTDRSKSKRYKPNNE